MCNSLHLKCGHTKVVSEWEGFLGHFSKTTAKFSNFDAPDARNNFSSSRIDLLAEDINDGGKLKF